MKSFFARLLVVFIFGLLPAVSLYLVAHRLFDQHRYSRFEEVKTRLRQELIRTADASSAGSFYFRLIESLLQQAGKKGVAPAEKTRLIMRAQSLCGSDLAVYFFDEKGIAQTLPGYSPPNRFVISKIWDILAETPAYRTGDEQRQLKRIQILLGAEASAGVIKNHEGQLLSLKKKRIGGYLYWKRWSSESLAGALVIVFPVLKPQEILARIFSRGSEENLQLAYWSHDQSDPLFQKGAQSDFNYLRGKIEKTSAEYLVEAGRLWLTLHTGAGVYLGSLSVAGLSGNAAAGMLNLLLAIALAGMAILLFSSSFDLRSIYLRTGSKLLALLLVAIAFPTAGLLLTGITAISTHERVLWSRLEKEKVTRLSAIEDDFSEEERSFGRHCESLHNLVLNDYSSATYSRAASAMIASGQAIRVDLVALDGEPISVLNSGSWFEGLEKSIDAYCRYLVENRLAQRSRLENVKIKRKSDAVLKDVFTSPDFGFAQITEAPGQIHSVRFGMNELLWHWNMINVPGHPAAILSIFQAKNIARENFLRRVMHEHAGNAEIFAVFNSAQQRWLDKRIGDVAGSDELMRAALLTDKPELRRIGTEKQKWLALAYPGKVLEPYSLMIMTDERVVSERIASLYRLLAIAVIVILVVALLIARLLTVAFLKPVMELDRGMMLVQKRHPDARVSIDAGDEFGELGLAFNQMVDELNEMQLARSVQESLFPQEKLAIPGFDTAVFNMAASDLGGDYCDYVKLDESRYLFLIGDVSGHGTSAALCMAMAKAAVFKACRDGFDFLELPGKISALLLRTLSRKKMMTMLFMLLNTEDCTLKLINAGHNWPLIIRRDGSFEEISLAGMPLGVRESRKEPDSRLLQLNPGDALFSYTDALIECQAPDGTVYGHEAMYVELARLSRLSPAATVAHMKAVWSAFLGGGIQQDDLTMLVIKNMTKEPPDAA